MSIWMLLMVSAQAADVAAADDVVAIPPAITPSAIEAPLWRGGARADLYGIVGVETELRQLNRDADQLVMLSADLDWGQVVTQAPRGDQTERVTAFSSNALTVQRQRVLDGSLIDRASSTADSGTYTLDNPNERARLCARLHDGSDASLGLHTWTERAHEAGENDRERRGRTPTLLVADGGDGGDRTAMVELQPGESVTLVELHSEGRTPRRATRHMALTRGQRTLSVTEGEATSRVCLDY